MVQVTDVPTEMVKLSNVKPCICEALVTPAARGPGVGVGTELEPPPVNGVGLDVGNLVAVGRTTVDPIRGIGVAVANRDLVRGTNGVAVTPRKRVAVG